MFGRTLDQQRSQWSKKIAGNCKKMNEGNIKHVYETGKLVYIKNQELKKNATISLVVIKL